MSLPFIEQTLINENYAVIKLGRGPTDDKENYRQYGTVGVGNRLLNPQLINHKPGFKSQACSYSCDLATPKILSRGTEC